MRLRPPQPDIGDRHALRPKTGDTVLYENTEYVVTRIGMRWLYMYRKTDPTKFERMAHVNEVTKVMPDALRES